MLPQISPQSYYLELLCGVFGLCGKRNIQNGGKHFIKENLVGNHLENFSFPWRFELLLPISRISVLLYWSVSRIFTWEFIYIAVFFQFLHFRFFFLINLSVLTRFPQFLYISVQLCQTIFCNHRIKNFLSNVGTKYLFVSDVKSIVRERF